ncbi:lipoyl(octanoyl) transferase LipB [Paraflavitalea sp. CAU 1676]|uniref:lipoyl(octanoyl) transferase LipB n=1 Tax=Paraflavitalea sp. CAU 1676 TaxID=3032598 RepID=UPI0023DC3E31|nr:lipoyl(octanoyl) transferase LipB [Paraflavitalea sp. CAU 1676]MDF2191765.1 lipoyl(octanoyl) transferase LipB [Paraflavitalea sp. CAU 1676]
MAHSDKQSVIFEDLQRMRYQDAWDYQESLLKENVRRKTEARTREAATVSEQGSNGLEINSINDAAGQPADQSTTHHLLFVEHPPVYTLGKSGDMANVLISDEERAARNIEFFAINRGGDITFHGPQQLVGYPILDLERFYTDIGKYLRNLEEVIILTMAEYGLKGERSAGETGVWLDTTVPGRERKICAMGIRCSRWITMHGFAFNVNTDLTYFDHIVPCGIRDKQVTSLQKELGYAPDFEAVKQKVKRNFEKVFNVVLQSADRTVEA